MRLSHWMLFALTIGAVACGSKQEPIFSEADGVTDDEGDGSDGDDDDNEDDENDNEDDEDSPATRDAGGGGGGVDDDQEDDESPIGSSGGPPTSTDPDADKCYVKPVTARPNSPEFLIVLDRSASMTSGGPLAGLGGLAGSSERWDPSVSAVKAFTSELTETVKFGLMLFPDPGGQGAGFQPPDIIGIIGCSIIVDVQCILDSIIPGGALDCEPGVVNVPVGLNTADDISRVLDMSGPDIGATPTSATLEAALAALGGQCADCMPVPKYVILVTDGQPTCGASGSLESDPEEVARSNAALDALLASEIRTYVIGYGTQSDPATAANMEEFAQHGGTEHSYAVEDEGSLVAELSRIAGALVPCEYDLSDDEEVETLDPTYVKVVIDDVQYTYGTDWTIEGKKIILTEGAAACSTLRDAKVHRLKITRECERVFVQ